MIPKKIHYCWFGGKELPAKFKAYIDTWRAHCPDYEIIEWNESNFDVAQNRYCREAHAAKKWAFVSDYARLKVLYEHGGVYMDTDVEVLKPFDDLLKYDFFMGAAFTTVTTHIMASKEKNDVVRKLLDDYEERKFIENNGFNMTTNVVLITNTLKLNYGLEPNNMRQIFGGGE